MAKDLAEVFKMFDSNGDERISRVERVVTFRPCRLHPHFASFDPTWFRSKSPLLESMTLNSKRPSVTSSTTGGDDEEVVADLQSVFGAFSDKDEIISTEEIRRVLSSVGDDHRARGTKMRTKSDLPFLWCSTLLAAGSFSYLPLVRASSASSPGSSDHSTLYYVGIGATIISTVIAVISLGATIYYRRRKRGETSVNPEA